MLFLPKLLFAKTEAEYHQIPLHAPQTDSIEEGTQNHRDENIRRNEWWWSMLPWFVAVALRKTNRQLPKKSSTSYLNGIRGVACIIVFIRHITDYWDESHNHNNAFGTDPAPENRGVGQLPIVRIIYAGEGMVSLFFVLSGFVLTYSPLRKINNASSPSSDSDLLTGLCSSILRRGVRLFAPAIPLIFLTCFATWNYPSFHPGRWRDSDPAFLEFLWGYVGIAMPLFNPFTFEQYMPPSFNHCWTLAVEYRGSMIVFLVCIATCRLTTRARKLVVGGSAFWALHTRSGDMFCFLSGMFLAELRYSPLSSDLPTAIRFTIPQSATHTLTICLLLFSMLVIGWPSNGAQGIEPFNSLEKLVPLEWRKGDHWSHTTAYFWSTIGAVGMLTAVENLPSVQQLLSTTPILYLGEISFSFYLLHWMAYLWPGAIMMHYLTKSLGWPQGLSFYSMFLITLALTTVAADYYWRAVDEKCVWIGKALVDWLGVYDDSTPRLSSPQRTANRLTDEDQTLPVALDSVTTPVKQE
ncbi:acyltransferase family-domain-containing protein [Truncatella angustata]|uniref:Acyltransferase family-domain-containing protein n=1 Tax=Truncatella angustata TaxID=152316 RepID=A0A9P8UGJ8_9PEZI|nr:acyltransferase family-domain-containing protein [Truncatella angustata]KAH6651741.1 acyltransferase family-domain-containing protein [Truncatella angustata]